MTAAKLLRNALIVLFTLFNGLALYLFLLQFPYGIDPLLLSIAHWRALSPQIGIVAAIAGGAVVLALAAGTRLGERWKLRLLYARWHRAHPAHQAFFSVKEPGFDRKPLYAAYPAIKDSAYDPQVQYATWQTLYRKHAAARLVSSTHNSWALLRDLYVVSLVFLGLFLVGWAVNYDMPLQIVSSHIFIFGTETLFLLVSARSAGTRLVNNVLATELGIGPDNTGGTRKRQA